MTDTTAVTAAVTGDWVLDLIWIERNHDAMMQFAREARRQFGKGALVVQEPVHDPAHRAGFTELVEQGQGAYLEEWFIACLPGWRELGADLGDERELTIVFVSPDTGGGYRWRIYRTATLARVN